MSRPLDFLFRPLLPALCPPRAALTPHPLVKSALTKSHVDHYFICAPAGKDCAKLLTENVFLSIKYMTWISCFSQQLINLFSFWTSIRSCSFYISLNLNALLIAGKHHPGLLSFRLPSMSMSLVTVYFIKMPQKVRGLAAKAAPAPSLIPRIHM